MLKKKCVICGDQKFKLLYVLSSSMFSNIDKKFYVVECKKCGLIFIKNPPTEKELERMYSEEYFDKTEHNFDSEAFENKMSRWVIKIYNEILTKIEKYSKVGHILDIGTGLGSFLRIAKKRGWIVHGIEPSKMMAKYCKEKLKFDIRECFVGNAEYKNSSFDAVNMGNVFEHLRDPFKTLMIVKKWIKKKGVLVIEVPNEGGLLYTTVRIYKRAGYHLRIKNNEKLLQHLFYYDINSLTKLLRKAGFEVIESSTRGTGTTRGLNPVLSIIQKTILTVSRFSKYNGDVLTVFAKKSKD